MPAPELPNISADDLRRHDLLMDVTVIMGFAQLLQRKIRRMPDLSDREQQELNGGLGAIVAAGQRLSLGIVRAGEASSDET